jgi:hypothetical protein
MAPRKRRAAVGSGSDGGVPDREDQPIDVPERGPGSADAVPPVRVAVEVDTLVTRLALGPGCKTFVAAGTLIPAGLESLPRAPA